jgi:hypothetical protein
MLFLSLNVAIFCLGDFMSPVLGFYLNCASLCIGVALLLVGLLQVLWPNYRRWRNRWRKQWGRIMIFYGLFIIVLTLLPHLQ